MCTREGRRGPSGPPRPFWLPVWDLAAQGTLPGRGSLHNYGFIYTTSLPNAQEGGPPFSNKNRLHAPLFFHPLRLIGSTMRAAAHTRHSGNAAHAERGPTCMCVRRAPSRARLRVAPPGSACSRRLCPAVCRRDRAHAAAARGNPDESVAADASGDIARRTAGTRQMKMWGLLVFRAACSRAGLGAGDLSVRAEGPRFEDGR